MRAFRPDAEVDDLPLLEQPLARGLAPRRRAAQDDQELFGPGVEVVQTAAPARKQLVDRRTELIAPRQPGRAVRGPLLGAFELPVVAPDVQRAVM